MTWAWIKHAVKQNPVTFMLLLSILIGYGYDHLPIPEGNMQHIKQPDEPHSYWWFGKFITIYLVGFIFQINTIAKHYGWFKMSKLDGEVMIIYFFIDFVGFLSYYYQGWPEPKALFIVLFCAGVLFILFKRLWKLTSY